MSQVLRFTQLRLRNWRNFTAVDVPLARRMFVVGPNAVGKSNLLDVFRFLRHLTVEGGGLAQAVKTRRGLSRLRSLHQKGRNSDVEIEVKAIDSDGGEWRYLLAFNRAGKGGREELPVVKKEEAWYRPAGSSEEQNKLLRPDDNDKDDALQLTQTAVQQVAKTRQFRPLKDFFASVTYLHLVPQLIREEQLPPEDALGGDLYGRDLLFRIRATPSRSQEARLARIRDALKLAVPNLNELELVLDKETSRPHLQAAFVHWRDPAAKQDEREFSDGTLRLIGLLWALQEPAGPLLLEEPELSLHSGIVRHLAPFIARAQRGPAGRQALVSTHNDLLMSDPGIGADEVLLVRPANEGSVVIQGASQPDIRRALQNGLTAADVVMPLTAMQQIDLFADLKV
jgi:predicted ATPase